MTTLIDMLKVDEGCRLAAYADTMGHKTIGYGHLITAEDDLPDTITQAQADSLLLTDIDRITHGIMDALPWFSSIDGPRRLVLLDMAFNLGVHGLLQFRHTLQAIQAQDYVIAADCMKSSPWYIHVGIRAQRLCAIIKSGIVPDDYANFYPTN